MDTNNAISFGSLVISASALCLSIYATCRTRKLEKLQIKSVSAELDASKKADVRAKIIKVGSNRYYLKSIIVVNAQLETLIFYFLVGMILLRFLNCMISCR